MTKNMVAPSILSADFANLKHDVERINNSNADWFHVDIMDGVFVPNISFGFPVIKAIKKYATKPLDVHLMIVQPERFIKTFAAAGADILTVHYEACTHLHKTIQEIKAAGMQAGVSLNPHTPIHVLEAIIADIDLVLIMSVNPGFGGQSFIENSLKKVTEVKALIKASGSKALIEVDGGVSDKNVKILRKNGADVLVAGSYIFKATDFNQAVDSLK
jgi:ribulose-phosphate 3-epimerase